MKAKTISCIAIIASYGFLYVWSGTHVPSFNEPSSNFDALALLGIFLAIFLSFIGTFALIYITIRWVLK